MQISPTTCSRSPKRWQRTWGVVLLPDVLTGTSKHRDGKTDKTCSVTSVEGDGGFWTYRRCRFGAGGCAIFIGVTDRRCEESVHEICVRPETVLNTANDGGEID
jgi:hypothetical protein